MKINTSKKPYKKLALMSAVIVVALLGYTTYAATTDIWPFTKSQQTAGTTVNQPSKDTTDASSEEDTSTPAVSEDTDTTTVTDTPKTPENNESSTTKNEDKIAVTITSVSNDDDVLKVRSLIEAITSSGTCTLTLTKEDSKLTKTSGIQALPSSSTCKGFSIPTTELSRGTWSLALSVISEGKTGSTTTSFEVK